ncbi:hypothetical protein ACFWH1_18380 [Streptomyces sp. NPDC127037]|uniref:hypothetical protein n=1 Tax=Streptomyces sp. NPDC127037 TaxID=3347113 RepID=UPI00365653FC
MSNEPEAREPELRNPRYFAKEDEGVQVVYNLRDAAPYFELGYEEVGEAAYLASLPDIFASPLPTASDGD